MTPQSQRPRSQAHKKGNATMEQSNAVSKLAEAREKIQEQLSRVIVGQDREGALGYWLHGADGLDLLLKEL